MFSWFFNLFKRKPYEERLMALAESEHVRAGRDIKRTPDVYEFTPLAWDDVKPVVLEPDGRTADGVYWAWMGGMQAGGAQEIKPPYNTYLVAPRGRLPNRRVAHHEYGHKHLIICKRIMRHDPRFDWAFWLWAYSRRMTDRVFARIAHPTIGRCTNFRAVVRDGLLVDEIQTQTGE